MAQVPPARRCASAGGDTVRNITVSVDDETHRLARVRAAEQDTSVSALVRDFLRRLADGDAAIISSGSEDNADAASQRRARLLAVIEDITAAGGGLLMSENLPRDQLHDRHALR